MSKKDYVLIASVLNTLGERCKASNLSGLHMLTVLDFADRLELENTRFDRERFISACGQTYQKKN